MTAIDIAVQSKALGSEEVTMVYRRGHVPSRGSRPEPKGSSGGNDKNASRG